MLYSKMRLALLLLVITEVHQVTEASSPDVTWWKDTVIYQIYPRSFMDSNGDGIGDLKGIASRLDYLSDLGVGTVWLNSIFQSPMKDFGYDISNYTNIDPVFGTLDDFENLIVAFHERNIKVILDLVPNHSSDQHEWFIKSRNRIEPYTDYYIWHNNCDENTPPPNNWISGFGGSMWTCDPVRGQFYLHQYLKEQPDLNFGNYMVEYEMNKVLKFWLDRGVDGFRLNAIVALFEDKRFKNETKSGKPGKLPGEFGYLKSQYTRHDQRIFHVLSNWRRFVNAYEKVDGHHRLLLAEVYTSMMETMKYFGASDQPLCDFPFNFQLLPIDSNTNGHSFMRMVNKWLKSKPKFGWSNWLVGNHDKPRIGTRGQPELRNAYNMLVTLLPGTAITYYGEEIGMLNGHISFEDTVDPRGLYYGTGYMKRSRDPQRTPMQWENTTNAGFSTAKKTWLPVNSNYQYGNNVKDQNMDPKSMLTFYKKLVKLRQEKVFRKGLLEFPVVTDEIFSFARYLKNYPTMYAAFINLSKDVKIIDLTNITSCKKLQLVFPTEATIVLHSVGYKGAQHSYPGNTVQLKELTLNPLDAILISFLPKSNENEVRMSGELR